jgi:hypothetical protein
MRKLKLNSGIALVILAIFTGSCKNTNEEGNNDREIDQKPSEMREKETGPSGDMSMGENQDSQTGLIVQDYLKLKDALVADNSEEAANTAKSLVTAFEDFNKSQYDAGEQQELNEIIVDAKEHAEHISTSDMAHQREHFEILSVDLVDLLKITGSPQTLYKQFCPMYNKIKGEFG